MILKRNHFIGPLGSLKINQHLIKWSSSSKLLGVTIDNKLTWTKHILELKRGFVNKLNLIKRSRFLPRNSLLDLFFFSHFSLGYIRVQINNIQRILNKDLTRFMQSLPRIHGNRQTERRFCWQGETP